MLPNYKTPFDDDRLNMSGHGKQLESLLAIFRRVCDSLDLDPKDEALARTITRTLIEAALAGERDPEVLYQRALQAALAS